jgi:hypothetical protein
MASAATAAPAAAAEVGNEPVNISNSVAAWATAATADLPADMLFLSTATSAVACSAASFFVLPASEASVAASSAVWRFV